MLQWKANLDRLINDGIIFSNVRRLFSTTLTHILKSLVGNDSSNFQLESVIIELKNTFTFNSSDKKFDKTFNDFYPMS